MGPGERRAFGCSGCSGYGCPGNNDKDNVLKMSSSFNHLLDLYMINVIALWNDD